MQIPTIILTAFLLAFTTSCKNKQEVAATPVKNPTTQVAETGDPAPAVSENAPDQPMEPVTPTKLGDDSVFFSIERTACFGTCPTYKLTIMQDGSATYVGRRFAEREGRYTGHVDAATMNALKEEAEARGFYAMDDVYDRAVTDLPSVIIRVHADHGDKQVVGRVGTPQAFKNFTVRAEELLSKVEWTKVGDLR
ncbi:MAG: DUF6438 domain-containing protein [Flavobacteriales bacterium]|jgi:hypothetical protein|nr:DUF6438 domain-containing protein [Flavobacteriales bacterium]MCB0757483.1 hypothetical protein [Flavobacteriales bacterium]